MNQLTEDQMIWLDKAIEKGHTYLEVKKKLAEAKYAPQKIQAMLDEYEKMLEGYKIEEESNPEEEKVFKKKVMEFVYNEDSPNLTKKDKKEIKRFLKNITQYQAVLKKSIEQIKKEIEQFEMNLENKKEKEKEKEYLKTDIIDRIIDSKSILDIEHPHTGEEATKENLKSLSLDELIELLEENVEALQIIVNGKIE